jgi:hypothetical protein
MLVGDDEGSCRLVRTSETRDCGYRGKASRYGISTLEGQVLDDVAGTPRERQGSGRRKMLARIIAFSLCLIFLICIWIKVTDYRDFRRDLTTYQGVKLGDSMDEIKYALGHPPFVLSPETYDADFDGYLQYAYQTDGKDPKNAMPDGKNIEDFLYWAYEEADRRIDLAFDPNTKTSFRDRPLCKWRPSWRRIGILRSAIWHRQQ